MNDSPEFKAQALSRRAFFGVSAGALATVLIAPGVSLTQVKAATQPGGASPKVRWGMLVDTNLCTPGCNECVTACSRENGLSATGPGNSWRSTDSQWIRKIEIKDVRRGAAHSVPVMCQHCAEPPCVDVCPTGASFKRADGIVLVDRHSCIGCRYCVMACPYKARSFVHEPLTGQNPEVPRGKGCAEGCTMCVQRIDKNEKPACVEACAAAGHGAIIFGDLNDPQSEISLRIAKFATRQIRDDLRLDPGVRYQGI